MNLKDVEKIGIDISREGEEEGWTEGGMDWEKEGERGSKRGWGLEGRTEGGKE